MIKNIWYSFLIFLCVSCHTADQNIQQNDPLIGSWRLTETSEKKIFQKDNSKEEEKIENRILINFFNDHSFTYFSEQGEMKSGKWLYDPENRVGNFSASDLTDLFTLSHDTLADEMIMTLVNPKANSKRLFLKSGDAIKDSRKEPFSLSNNSWRIKPYAKENDQQIRKRLAGYFRHVQYVLMASEEREQQFLSLEFSMGIIKIYNSAIGIIPLNKVPLYWLNTFYDIDDAHNAYTMFEKYLHTYSYHGVRSGNWVENDIRILESILYDMQNGKF